MPHLSCTDPPGARKDDLGQVRVCLESSLMFSAALVILQLRRARYLHPACATPSVLVNSKPVCTTAALRGRHGALALRGCKGTLDLRGCKGNRSHSTTMGKPTHLMRWLILPRWPPGINSKLPTHQLLPPELESRSLLARSKDRSASSSKASIFFAPHRLLLEA